MHIVYICLQCIHCLRLFTDVYRCSFLHYIYMFTFTISQKCSCTRTAHNDKPEGKVQFAMFLLSATTL